MSDQVLDAEVLEPSADLVPAAPPRSLFRTEDPVEILTQAKAIADALAPVIRAAGLVKNVQGKDYLQVEAWQTLGQQVGVTPVIVSTRRLSDPDGWEARCEARTLDGRTIGAADSMCLKSEERWKDSEDFEVRSMAQTRAMSRALASVLRFIPTLAGMGGTPAEEMDRAANKGPRKPSTKQLQFLDKLIGENYGAGDASVIRALVVTLDSSQVSRAIGALKDGDQDVADELARSAREWAARQSDVPGDAAGMPADGNGDDEDIPF